MARIIDVSDKEADHDLLTSTSSGGLLGGQYLHDKPIASYLKDIEEPKYILRNKKQGVTIKGEDDQHALKPDNDFQALMIVTDIRVLFVVGKQSGDKSSSLPLVDIVQARSEDSGFLQSKLTVDTLADRTWEFPCRGETEEAAKHIDGLAQDWANAGRLLDDAEAQIEAAETHLENDEHDAARNALEGVEEMIQTAYNRLAETGEAARQAITERGRALLPRLEPLWRTIESSKAGSVHAEAQSAWQNEEYETAAHRYDKALQLYERAYDSEGDTPSDEVLAERIKHVCSEREILRIGPLVDADTARRHAAKLEDSEDAAEQWERVLESYRDMLCLTWAESERDFIADKGTVRRHAERAASDAIDDHIDAGQKWLGAGDKLANQDRGGQAIQVYERAEEQFERARQLAREVQPESLTEIEPLLEKVNDRLEGDGIPDESPEESPLPADAVSTVAETTTPADGFGATAEESGAVDSTGTTNGAAVGAATHGGAPETQSSSPLDRISSQKQNGSSSAESDNTSRDTDGGIDSTGQSMQTLPTDKTGTVSPTELRKLLSALDADKFTDLVASLWESKGWSTTVFSSAAAAVYDIVAIREDPDETRLLIWTAHSPTGGTIGPTVIERCATARDSSQGADSATVVTTGRLTTAAWDRAAELDITVVDYEELADIVQVEDVVARLEE